MENFMRKPVHFRRPQIQVDIDTCIARWCKVWRPQSVKIHTHSSFRCCFVSCSFPELDRAWVQLTSNIMIFEDQDDPHLLLSDQSCLANRRKPEKKYRNLLTSRQRARWKQLLFWWCLFHRSPAQVQRWKWRNQRLRLRPGGRNRRTWKKSLEKCRRVVVVVVVSDYPAKRANPGSSRISPVQHHEPQLSRSECIYTRIGCWVCWVKKPLNWPVSFWWSWTVYASICTYLYTHSTLDTFTIILLYLHCSSRLITYCMPESLLQEADDWATLSFSAVTDGWNQDCSKLYVDLELQKHPVLFLAER